MLKVVGFAVRDDQRKPADQLRNKVWSVILDPENIGEVLGELRISRSHIIVSELGLYFEKEDGFSGGEDLEGFHGFVESLRFT